MRLHGDENAEEIVWLEGATSGRRYTVTWPSGYSARFTPTLELLDDLGRPIAREGDVLEIEGPADLDRVGVCWIHTVNGIAVAKPIAPPEPTDPPRPTRGPTLAPGESPTPIVTPTLPPPPVGHGRLQIEVCGDDGIRNQQEGGDPIDLFVLHFHALQGQPDSIFPVANRSCEYSYYRVWAGRYDIEVSADGWETAWIENVLVLVGEDVSRITSVALFPSATPSPS